MLKTYNIDIHTKEEWEYVENFKEIIHDSQYTRCFIFETEI